MPNLKCTVDNCVHNSECCCELGEIAVKGHNAQYSDATCCSTFCECSDSLSNQHVDSQMESQTNIRCSAETCKYNENCNCHAEDIDICGDGACHAENTTCSTFCCH